MWDPPVSNNFFIFFPFPFLSPRFIFPADLQAVVRSLNLHCQVKHGEEPLPPGRARRGTSTSSAASSGRSHAQPLLASSHPQLAPPSLVPASAVPSSVRSHGGRRWRWSGQRWRTTVARHGRASACRGGPRRHLLQTAAVVPAVRALLVRVSSEGRRWQLGGPHCFWGDATPPLFEGRWGVFWWPPKKGGHIGELLEQEILFISPSMTVLWGLGVLLGNCWRC